MKHAYEVRRVLRGTPLPPSPPKPLPARESSEDPKGRLMGDLTVFNSGLQAMFLSLWALIETSMGTVGGCLSWMPSQSLIVTKAPWGRGAKFPPTISHCSWLAASQ